MWLGNLLPNDGPSGPLPTLGGSDPSTPGDSAFVFPWGWARAGAGKSLEGKGPV